MKAFMTSFRRLQARGRTHRLQAVVGRQTLSFEESEFEFSVVPHDGSVEAIRTAG